MSNLLIGFDRNGEPLNHNCHHVPLYLSNCWICINALLYLFSSTRTCFMVTFSLEFIVYSDQYRFYLYKYLVSSVEEEICEDGTVVVRQDEKNPYVRMVITGKLYIVRDNVRTYTVKQASFASESSYILVCYWKVMLGLLVILWRDRRITVGTTHQIGSN